MTIDWTKPLETLDGKPATLIKVEGDHMPYQVCAQWDEKREPYNLWLYPDGMWAGYGVRNAPAFTPSATQVAEAACCLWEAFLNDTTPYDDLLSEHGYSSVRLGVISVAAQCSADFEALDEYDKCFDWDFCPEWLATRIDWENASDHLHRTGELPLRQDYFFWLGENTTC